MDRELQVLIIDDSTTSQRLIEDCLKQSGCSVVTTQANSASDGLKFLDQEQFDCIFLDYVLPDLDGVQLLKQIREVRINTPVVVLTGQGSEPVAVEMMKAGATDYIAKTDLTPELLGQILRGISHLFEVNSQAEKTMQTIRQAQDDLAEAERRQSDFFARMSHEIRTPLNVILGTTDLLKSTELSTEQDNYVQTLQRAGHMLMVLINDVLDMSKMNSAELELRNIEFDLHTWFARTCSMMEVQAKGKDLGFSLEIVPGVPQRVKGDPDRLTQILVNLTGNAIKFTRAGQVAVRLLPGEESDGPGAVRLTVEDTGIGIPKDKQAIIFTSFHQGDKSVAQEYGGTGLGLAITRNLVEKMRGKIWVVSEPGSGSTFNVSVLFDLPPQELGDGVKSPESAEKGIATAMLERASGRLRILVAEDTFDNRLLIKSFLKRSPIDVDFAFNGQDAVDRFPNGNYDLILMDMEMPELNGFEATRSIRALEQAANTTSSPIPIVAITAHSFKEEREKCTEAGCTDFLMKPFKRESLLEKIHRHAVSKRKR